MSLPAAIVALPLLVPPEPVVEVVVDSPLVDGRALADHLGAQTRALLVVLPHRPTSPRRVRVEVTGELLDFEVRLHHQPGGHRSTARCRCTRAELVTHVLRRVAHRSTATPVRPIGPIGPARLAPPPPLVVHPPPPPPPVLSPSSSGLGPFGRTGVALGMAGGFGLGLGSGVLLAGRMATDERLDLRRDARPIGVVTVVVGACIGLSGALLLTHARHIRRTTGVAP